MSNFSDIGNLMQIYLEDITGNYITNTQIEKAAKVLLNNEGRNWIPIMVKETGVDQYEVVGDDNYVFSVCKVANIAKVWVIIVDDSDEGVTEIINCLTPKTETKTEVSDIADNITLDEFVNESRKNNGYKFLKEYYNDHHH